MKLKRFSHPAIAFGISFLILVSAWRALPKPPLTDGIDFSTRVRDRNGNVLRVTLTSDQKYRIWTPLHDISPALIEATVQFEDKYFARHPGVNPVPVMRAAWNLARFGRAHAGASTISMQLARLRFHLHTRTLAGKWRQILCAMELERHYSKDQILEAYLNLVPYGRNIEGAGAASEIYFGKKAARLSEPEAIALSVIPQSPSRRALVVGHENAALMAAQKRWSTRAGGHEARESLAICLERKRGPAANSQHRILFETCSRAKATPQKSAPRWIFAFRKYWSGESQTTSRRIGSAESKTPLRC